MSRLQLRKPDGTEEIIELQDECYIGRRDDVGNNIVLPDRIVSSKHAVITKGVDGYEIKDISANGSYLNGKKLIPGEFVRLKDGDKIDISSFTIIFQKVEKVLKPEHKEKCSEVNDDMNAVKSRIHELVIERMDLRKIDITKVDKHELYKNTMDKIKAIVAEIDSGVAKIDFKIPEEIDRDELIKDILDLSLGLGPLEMLLADPEITEIMVNSRDHIFIESGGKLTRSAKTFFSDEQVRSVIERIVAPLGRRIDESSPMVDARLHDGSRVNAVIPPLALKGPCITIRKFPEKKLLVDDLIKFGSITPQMAEFLNACVKARKNIIISGGTGSGKTTLLNIMASFIPDDERIVTIEDAAELKLPQENLVSLESRPPNIEGKGAITIRDLVINALRMRPDRIVIGECRGKEALDMLQAMNTGHDGSLTTCHANSPKDAIARLETMILMAGMELPIKAIRQQISSAINIIIQQSRIMDYSRKITHISEVTGMEGEIITMQDIFRFVQTGIISREDGSIKVQGYFTATGFVPKLIEELDVKGIKIPREVFYENREQR
ncbi:MAG: ATPase, T2SS/T4P/T4SS family [bacterium]|nr:ATPase, T2SS/T4P/T4SS family [bacterium]